MHREKLKAETGDKKEGLGCGSVGRALAQNVQGPGSIPSTTKNKQKDTQRPAREMTACAVLCVFFHSKIDTPVAF